MVIASVGPDLPVDLLLACGRYRGPLDINPGAATPTASQWLESKFAPFAPLVLEAWAQGEYDSLEAVIFSRADDSAQRLYYYICELQRRGLIGGPEPIMFDIAKIARPSSLEYTIAQVNALARRLGVDCARMENGITSANALRSARDPQSEGPACLLVGTAPPDQRLHDAVRAAGFVALGQTLAQQWADLGPMVDADSGDPAAAIGRQLHAREGSARSFADAGAVLAKTIAEAGCVAVVLWRIEEDEAQGWQLPAERRALEQSGLPYLVLTRRNWLAHSDECAGLTHFLQGVPK